MTDEQWAKMEPYARAAQVAEAAVQRGITYSQNADLSPSELLEHAILMRRYYIETNRAKFALHDMERKVLNA